MPTIEEEVETLRIDPRIRKRRNEVARSIGRKRLYLILGAFAILVCIGTVHVILKTSIFSISSITVKGSTNYPNSEIVATSGIRKGTPLSQLNPPEAISRISSLPFISSVAVKKRWPNTVDITVRERTALAIVPSTVNKVLVVDATGRVLEDKGSASGGSLIKLCIFPVISSSKSIISSNSCVRQSTNPGGNLPATYVPLLKVSSAIRANGVKGFQMLAVSANGEVDGLLTSGTVVRFGGAHNLATKLRSLELLLNQASTSGYTTIDVRVPGEPVLSNW